jgi:hypothetical protein
VVADHAGDWIVLLMELITARRINLNPPKRGLNINKTPDHRVIDTHSLKFLYFAQILNLCR